VHGTRVIRHGVDWAGWLRADAADGLMSSGSGYALAVSVADCVPVFVAHPNGAMFLLHAGWRGTAGGILAEGVAALRELRLDPSDLRMVLGPAICGRCYEVQPDVFAQLTGRTTSGPATVDLRAILANQARALGVHDIALSQSCTRCDNDRFFSHRAGDTGRQLGVIVSPQ